MTFFISLENDSNVSDDVTGGHFIVAQTDQSKRRYKSQGYKNHKKIRNNLTCHRMDPEYMTKNNLVNKLKKNIQKLGRMKTNLMDPIFDPFVGDNCIA